MPTAQINGVNTVYEELGQGAPVVVIPGGRSGKEGARPLAEHLASKYRAIIYDRRNCGASDVLISGDLSEQELWAEDLYHLLKYLDTAPAYISGGSSGCRVGLLLAIRHPEVVKGLLLWYVSGGTIAAQQLGYNYYEQYIEIAEKQGMQGVIESEFFAERIAENPSNRERLLAMDPAEFIEVMRRWRTFFTDDKPVIGATEEELKTIDVPMVIVPGNDDVHLLSAGENLHRILPDSEFHPPMHTPEERTKLMEIDPVVFQRITAGKLAEIFLPFLEKITSA
jgi:pimeloyl-ACP methyl ester carboxylesterase